AMPSSAIEVAPSRLEPGRPGGLDDSDEVWCGGVIQSESASVVRAGTASVFATTSKAPAASIRGRGLGLRHRAAAGYFWTMTMARHMHGRFLSEAYSRTRTRYFWVLSGAKLM